MATKTTTPSGLPNMEPQQISPMDAQTSPKVPSFSEQVAAGTVQVKSATPPQVKGAQAEAPKAPAATAPTQQPKEGVADFGPKTVVSKGDKTREIFVSQLPGFLKAGFVEGTAEQKIQETAPTVAESTSKVNPDGSTTTDTKDYSTPEAQEYKKQLDDAISSVDTEIEYAKSKYTAIAATADAAQAAFLKSIEKTFEVRKYEMERINKAALNTQQLLGARSGRQRYAPELQTSILSEEERAGLIRLTEIEALEYQTIAMALKAATDEDLMILNQQMSTLGDLRDEKNSLVQNMYDLAVVEEQRAQARAKFAIDYEKSVQEYEQQASTFEREEQDLATTYAAINLVGLDEFGNVTRPSSAKISQIAQTMGIDPMQLEAMVTLRGQEVEQIESDMRSEYLSQQQQEMDLEMSNFDLTRAQTLLPFEIKTAEENLKGLALENATTLSELEEATMNANTGELSEDETKELLKNESYKNLKGNELLDTALNNFKDKVDEFLGGGKGLDVLSNVEIAELNSLRMGLAATLKQAKTLGTLDQGVENLVNGLIGEIPKESFKGFKVGLFYGLQTKVNSAIEQNSQEANLNYEQLIAENPVYQNSPAVERLYRKINNLPNSFSEWANDPNNLEEAEMLTQSIINAGGNPDNPEDVEQAWNAIYGFSQPLSMGKNGSDVSSIKDFTKVTTAIGSGTATGIEKGSKFWEYGFDFVLDGGKGAPVKQPFSGTVVEAGDAGGFGKSVVIQLADGTKIRSSHLDSINVGVGQKVNSKTVLGGQGNTGKTYGKTGIHVDYTMYKPDGSLYSSQEVASLFNTKAIA